MGLGYGVQDSGDLVSWVEDVVISPLIGVSLHVLNLLSFKVSELYDVKALGHGILAMHSPRP